MIAAFLAFLLVGAHAAVTRANSDPRDATLICAGAHSEGTLIAHENCHKFYECAGGVPVAFECPEDLNFNPGKNQCDWKDNVDCSGREINELSEDLSDIQVNGFYSKKATLSKRVFPFLIPKAATICAGDKSDGILVAHKDCHKFYECAGGVPVAFDCPEDRDFNTDTNRCDLPDNVDCSGRNRNATKSTKEAAISQRSLSRNLKDNSDPSQAITICAAAQSEGTLIAHENCHKFYECAKGRPIAVSCPPNLLYNPNKEYCDWPENVDCSGREVLADFFKDIIKESGRASINNQVLIHQVNEDNEKRNINTNYASSNIRNNYVIVNSRKNRDPSEAVSICAQPDSESVLVAHEDCNKFYKCFKGSPVPIVCPWGLLYDVEKEVCDWAENVDCGGRNQ